MAIIGFGIYGRSETDRIGKGTVFHESLRINLFRESIIL
jgi:hypothetical protein